MIKLPNKGRRSAFQSTLPARGATIGLFDAETCGTNFNPRSPHGERLFRRIDLIFAVKISIHAPRTGSDVGGKLHEDAPFNFNPRSPHGERRGRRGIPPRPRHFNPRSPHGERLVYIGVVQENIDISIHAPRTGSDAPS